MLAGGRPGTIQLRSSPLWPRLLGGEDKITLDFGLAGNINAFVALLPVDGAALAELVLENKGVEDAKGFSNAAANVSVVDCDVTDVALGVDDEEGTLSYAFFFDQDAIVAAKLMVRVADEWNVDAAETALHLRGGIPGSKGMLVVCAGEDDSTRAVV